MFRQIIKRHAAVHQKPDATIGFVGVGNMGAAMCVNLVNNSQHKVKICDLKEDRIQYVMDRVVDQDRVSVAKSPATLAKDTRTIITMVENDRTTNKVYNDRREGLLKSAKPDTLFLCSSTISPNVARSIARQVRGKKCTFLDTPVCGGVNAAENKALTFIIANRREADFRLAKNVLQYMGKQFCSVPGVGNGEVGKICHQVTLAINMIATCEAMNLGIRLGADREELTRIINASSGGNYITENYHPVPGMGDIFGGPSVPSGHNYDGGFACRLMQKDLALAQEAAASVSAHTPLAMTALQIYRTLCVKGYSEKDYASPYHLFASDVPEGKDPVRAFPLPSHNHEEDED